MRSLLLLFAICAAAAVDVQVPQDLFALTLTVTDEASQPIADAEVSLETKVVGYTDAEGKYFLPRADIAPGPYHIHVVAAGFQKGTAALKVSDSGDVLPKALSFQLHRAPREAPIVGLVTPGVDTIDATAVSTDLIGHNYFGANNSIITDAKKLIEFGWPPPQRNLIPVVRATLTYWVIPGPK
jgi:Carboxypeptidase regulatory-like domain